MHSQTVISPDIKCDTSASFRVTRDELSGERYRAEGKQRAVIETRTAEGNPSMSPFSQSLDATPRPLRLLTRMAAYVFLLATLVVIGWLGMNIFYICIDSWIAPLHLSPDNDQVIQLRLRHNRQLAELDRVEAEVVRIDGELEGVSTAIERLSSVSENARWSMKWEADFHTQRVHGLDQLISNMEGQRVLLLRLRKRQRALTEAAQRDFAAGLLDRNALEEQQQALDSLELSLTENDRRLTEVRLQREESRVTTEAFRAGLNEDVAANGGLSGRMPQVAAGQEHSLRIEIELIRLRSEQRSLRALRKLAAQGAATERAILDDIKGRPLYRAMTESTYVAFVPYDEILNVGAGASVLSCMWGLFDCLKVGNVTEMLPGEVVAKDPWGELVRGQYAILHLDDITAIQNKLLRLRIR